MATFSKAKLRETLEGLFAKVANGTRLDEDWKAQMVDAAMPELPDDPAPEQIEAWNEIIKMITDKTAVAEMHAEIASMWSEEFDPSVYAEASSEMLAKVREAIDRGEQPVSASGTAIAREWFDKIAKALKREPDGAFMEWARKHQARSSRYQELLVILRGDEGKGSFGREWLSIHEAIEPLLTSAA